MKWFDENGTDVDAYPQEAFKGGVYGAEHQRNSGAIKTPRTVSSNDGKFVQGSDTGSAKDTINSGGNAEGTSRRESEG